jgi:hypothetical protein
MCAERLRPTRVVLEGHVVAFRDERVAGVLEPVGRTVDRVPLVARLGPAEQRRAAEAVAAALRALRHLVALVQRHFKPAVVAPERSGPCKGPGAHGFHRRCLSLGAYGPGL